MGSRNVWRRKHANVSVQKVIEWWTRTVQVARDNDYSDWNSQSRKCTQRERSVADSGWKSWLSYGNYLRVSINADVANAFVSSDFTHVQSFSQSAYIVLKPGRLPAPPRWQNIEASLEKFWPVQACLRVHYIFISCNGNFTSFYILNVPDSFVIK